MSNQHQPRERWLAKMQACMQSVGECQEWTGPYVCGVPCVYCPRGYVWPGNSQQRQSMRAVLWALKHGERPPVDQVIRPTCRNSRCVAEQHWLITDRKHQAQEQSARGELQTTNRREANIAKARRTGKLDENKVRHILWSKEPAPVEAKRLGVTPATITAVRRRQLWAGIEPAKVTVCEARPDYRFSLPPDEAAALKRTGFFSSGAYRNA